MKFILIVSAILMLTACIQSPTTNTQVVDDRPGLTFSLPSRIAETYELFVDGVSYGSVGQYQTGRSLLKLVDGTHLVELVSDGQVVFSQKVYLGAGANREIKVGSND